jgi:hypothetical protein
MVIPGGEKRVRAVVRLIEQSDPIVQCASHRAMNNRRVLIHQPIELP